MITFSYDSTEMLLVLQYGKTLAYIWEKKSSERLKKKADCRPWHGYVRQAKEQQNFSDKLLFTIATE